MINKTYKCRRCGKILDEYKPLRLVYQVHTNKKPYGKYENKKNFDYCYECFKKIKKVLIERKYE